MARGAETVEKALGQSHKVTAPVRLGSLEDLTAMPPGTVQAGPAGSRLYVVRLPAGLLVLSGRCPHDGSLVPWRPRDTSEDGLASHGRFYCGADASIFDRRGVPTVGAAPRPMDTLPIQLRDGILWADPSMPIERAIDDLEKHLFRLKPSVGS